MRGELKTYQAKRRFGETPEPKGAKGKRAKGGFRYLIQRHADEAMAIRPGTKADDLDELAGSERLGEVGRGALDEVLEHG